MRKKLLLKRFSLTALSVIGVATTASTSVLLSGKLSRAKDDRSRNDNTGYPGGDASGFDPNDNNGQYINHAKGQKVNYVALGDSIAAGFTAFNAKDNNYVDYNATDHKTTTHQIYGDAYSAWVARSLKKQGVLGSYDNLAVGGYTTGNLLKSIDDLYTPTAIDIAHRNGITDSGKFDKGFMSRGDWNNYYRNEAKIKSTITNANLVSVTIGANDMLNLINLLGQPLLNYMSGNIGNITDIIKKVMHPADGKKFDWNSAVSVDPIKLSATFKSMEENTKKVVSTIRALNPNAKIMMVGYEMPLMQLRNVLDLAIVNGQTLVEQIITQLNQTMKIIANQYASVDYINTDDSDKFMYNNQLSGNVTLPKTADSTYKANLTLDHYNPASWYMPVSIDIHPGPYGYRAAAADMLSALAITPATDSQPNNANVDKSKVRIQTTTTTKAGFQDDINSYNDPFADLTNKTLPISPANPDPVAYLQPQIAHATLYNGHATTVAKKTTTVGPFAKNAMIYTALSNSMSDTNNLLLMMRNKIATAINDANSNSGKTKTFADLKTFANKYAKTDSNGKATNLTLQDVSFDILADFGKLKENIIIANDPNASIDIPKMMDTDNSMYTLYYALSGMMTDASATITDDQKNVFSTSAIGYVWVSDLFTNLKDLNAFNLIPSIIPFINLNTVSSSNSVSGNLSASAGMNPNLIQIGAAVMTMIDHTYYFSNQLRNILWDTVHGIQTNYMFWNQLYQNKITHMKLKGVSMPLMLKIIFKHLNVAHFGTTDKTKWTNPISSGYLSAPNTPVAQDQEVA